MIVVKTKVRKKSEYDARSKMLFSMPMRPYYVPMNEDAWKVIGALFARSGRQLIKGMPAEIVVYGHQRVERRRYGCSTVVLEKVDARLMRISFSKDVSRWMRSAVVRFMMKEDKSLSRFAAVATPSSIRELSELWKEYVDSGSKKSFRVWLFSRK